MNRPAYLYLLAHTYFEHHKGRASEMEVLNIYLEAEEAGNTRRSLDRILKTVDLLQRRKADERQSENGRNETN